MSLCWKKVKQQCSKCPNISDTIIEPTLSKKAVESKLNTNIFLFLKISSRNFWENFKKIGKGCKMYTNIYFSKINSSKIFEIFFWEKTCKKCTNIFFWTKKYMEILKIYEQNTKAISELTYKIYTNIL